MESNDIEIYLNWRWKRYNHKKYHKYYELWRENVTDLQLEQIGKQRHKDLNY